MDSIRQDASSPRYASVSDGARYAAVSDRTIRRCIDSGKIRGYRLGPRVLRVNLDEIDRLLQGGELANG